MVLNSDKNFFQKSNDSFFRSQNFMERNQSKIKFEEDLLRNSQYFDCSDNPDLLSKKLIIDHQNSSA